MSFVLLTRVSDIRKFLSCMKDWPMPPTFSEYEKIIKDAVGESGLMEFLRVDLGSTLRKDPAAKAFQIVRIIAGNPLIMKLM